MRRLPVDTSEMTFMCTAPPKPVLDFESQRQRADENGELLYSLQVVAIVDDGAEVINVKVPGEPPVNQGQMVTLNSLIASPWSIGDRSGVAFRADSVEAANGNRSATGRTTTASSSSSQS